MSNKLITAIFTLTEPGRLLATRLCQELPYAQHYHRPKRFTQTIQKIFTHRIRCVFICSTGIAMRTLAPVLQDKHQDPAVLVLDENGEYVIPLLSGHEGGGYEFGRKISNILSANLVMTSVRDYSKPIYTVGIGCEKNCSVSDLHSLYISSLTLLPDVTPIALASIDIKILEFGLIELSHRVKLKFRVYSAQKLREVEHLLSVLSERVFREVGCYGVAEAAALCSATELTGQESELVLNKKKNKKATIAVARSYYMNARRFI